MISTIIPEDHQNEYEVVFSEDFDYLFEETNENNFREVHQIQFEQIKEWKGNASFFLSTVYENNLHVKTDIYQLNFNNYVTIIDRHTYKELAGFAKKLLLKKRRSLVRLKNGKNLAKGLDAVISKLNKETTSNNPNDHINALRAAEFLIEKIYFEFVSDLNVLASSDKNIKDLNKLILKLDLKAKKLLFKLKWLVDFLTLQIKPPPEDITTNKRIKSSYLF